jgi:hypothetical protein
LGRTELSQQSSATQSRKVRQALVINAYRIGTLKNTPLDEAPRRKVNKLESGYEIVLDNSSALG